MIYLVQFTYDHYCQGWEDATISVLVHVSASGDGFEAACKKIKEKYDNARNFVNLTIE